METYTLDGVLSYELHGDHAEGERDIPRARTPCDAVSRQGGALARSSPLVQVPPVPPRRQTMTADRQPTLTTEEIRPLIERREPDRREVEPVTESSRKMPGFNERVDTQEGGCRTIAIQNTATRTAAASNTRGSSNRSTRKTDYSEETFRKKAQVALENMCITLQRYSEYRAKRASSSGGRGEGHDGGGDDALRASACTTSALLDPVTRSPYIAAAPKTPAHESFPSGCEGAPCMVTQGLPAATTPRTRPTERRASAGIALQKNFASEMTSVPPSVSALNSTASQSVSLPRVDCSHHLASPAPEQSGRTTGALPVSFEEASVMLLLEQILGKTGTVPLPISTLISSLTGTSLRGNRRYKGTEIDEGASSVTLQDQAECGSDRVRNVSSEHVEKSAHEESTPQGRRGLALALGIQKLPAGRRLEDYFLIGPVLDVCLPPPQPEKPDNGGLLPHKRPHPPGTTHDGKARKGSMIRKICRRGSSKANRRDATTTTPSSAGGSRITEEAAKREVSESRRKPGAQNVQDAGDRERTDVPLRQQGSTGVEEGVATRKGQLSKRAADNRPPSPSMSCGNAGVPDKRSQDVAPPAVMKLSDRNAQAQNAACISGRPILRSAVARSAPLAIQRNTVKIIKSIDKKRIPASAGGERLWRRLCERLLNLPAHPNVLSVEAVLEDAANYHFVFERLEGGELFALLLKEKVVEEHLCQYIVYQILMALHHLHSHNLLHRDIKPENVVFRRGKQTTPEPLADECGPSLSPSSVPSSSSTLLPSATSNTSSSSSLSPSYYSEIAFDHSFTNTWSFPSTSPSSPGLKYTNGAGASSSNHPCRMRGGSPTDSVAQAGSPRLPLASASRYSSTVPSSLLNNNSGCSRRWGGCDAEAAASGDKEYNQSYDGRRADHVMRQTLRDYELVLIDFDTCKMMEVPTEEYKEVVAGRRRLVGTYGYLAPEILCGHAYSVQSDLWSVGIIMYILLTGIPPLPMEEMVSACTSLNVFVQMHEKNGGILFDIPPLSDSPLAQDLCQRLLRLSPKDRVSSASAALSHSWFDNLNRLAARGDLRTMTGSRICTNSPAGDHATAAGVGKWRMPSDEFQPFRGPRAPAPPPLKLPSLQEACELPRTFLAGQPPLEVPASSATLLERVYYAADPATRGGTHIYSPRGRHHEEEHHVSMTREN